MGEIAKTQRQSSVRNLVEFIFREGDIDNRAGKIQSADAMLEGTRIHRKIQKSKDKTYQAEVPLNYVVHNPLFELTIEGRADGIFTEENENGEELVFIDEIKGMYKKVLLMEESVFVHKAQAMCYAFIFAYDNELSNIGVQMTY